MSMIHDEQVLYSICYDWYGVYLRLHPRTRVSRSRIYLVSRSRSSYEKKKIVFRPAFSTTSNRKRFCRVVPLHTHAAHIYYIHRRRSDVIDDIMVCFGSIYNNTYYYNGGSAEEI